MRWVMAADDACMVRFSGCLVLVALAFNGCGDTAKTGAQTSPELTASAGASPTVATTTAAPVVPTVSGAPPVLLGDVEVAPPERDDSPALLAHLEARRRQAMKLLRDAAAAPRSAAGGCVRGGPGNRRPPATGVLRSTAGSSGSRTRLVYCAPPRRIASRSGSHESA